MRFWLPIAVVAFIACCIGIYYYFSDPYYSRLLQFKTSDLVNSYSTPDDLQDATYLLSASNSGGLYSKGKLTFEEYAQDGSAIHDLVREGSHEAKIRLSPLTRTYELSVNGKAISEITGEPRGLFLSPDASYVGVVVHMPDTPYFQPSSLELYIYNVVTGNSFVLEGFAGMFIDERTVLAFRASGAVLVDLESGEESVVREEVVTAAYTTVVFDRTNSRIAYGLVNGDVQVHEVIRGETISLVSLATFKGSIGTLALTSGNVYVVSDNEDGGSFITRHGIFEGDSQVVRMLPRILTLQKIIP